MMSLGRHPAPEKVASWAVSRAGVWMSRDSCMICLSGLPPMAICERLSSCISSTRQLESFMLFSKSQTFDWQDRKQGYQHNDC